MAVALSNSLANAARKLSNNEARQIWAFIDKFWANPAHPSLSLERISKHRADSLWSCRISSDLRAILHKENDLWTVLHVDHHDAAYEWIKTRTVERHLKTGVLQIVGNPGLVPQKKIESVHTEEPPLFEQYSNEYLLNLGVPPSWLAAICQIQSKETLLNLALKLPEEVAERLLDLAEGTLIQLPTAETKLNTTVSQTLEPGAIVLDTNQDLLKLLDAPWATWTTFLHPSQQQIVNGTFKGPIKITGAAGTGKTVVGLHRARHLARQGKRVLLTSFVSSLCHNLERNLKLLCTPEELDLITVSTVHRQAKLLLNQAGEFPEPVGSDEIKSLIDQMRPSKCLASTSLLVAEWEKLSQSGGFALGDETTYSKSDRHKQLLEQVFKALQSRNQSDWTEICRRACEILQCNKVQSPFDAVIVDELQDLGTQEIKLIAAIAGEGSDRLTLLGDSGQRIYAGHPSLKSLGVNVKGRSYILRVNYRTTAQINRFAEQVFGNQLPEPHEEARESRRETINLIEGTAPVLQGFKSQTEQIDFITRQIKDFLQTGVMPGEIAVFSRTNIGLEAVESSLKTAKITYQRLTRNNAPTTNTINIGTFHRAKGLEFKIVFVINLSINQMPPQAVSQIQSPRFQKTALARERRLLYVSVTRARDQVFATWVGKQSLFLAC